MGTLDVLGMGLFWLILLAMIGWLVVRVLPASGQQPTPATGESALEILDRRMASGELDMAQWHAQRGALLAAQRERKSAP
jgi:putative membrane protein